MITSPSDAASAAAMHSVCGTSARSMVLPTRKRCAANGEARYSHPSRRTPVAHVNAPRRAPRDEVACGPMLVSIRRQHLPRRLAVGRDLGLELVEAGELHLRPDEVDELHPQHPAVEVA